MNKKCITSIKMLSKESLSQFEKDFNITSDGILIDNGTFSIEGCYQLLILLTLNIILHY